jgi:hypothetical protein
MPTDNQSIHTSSPHRVRCLLFDLGYTLWDRRRDKQAGELAETKANRLTGAVLRHHRLSEQIVVGDDQQVGNAFRTRFDDAEHEFIRRHTGLEPDGPQLVRETLRQWGVENVGPDVSEAIFHALQIHIAAPSFLFEDTIPTLTALQARGRGDLPRTANSYRRPLLSF